MDDLLGDPVEILMQAVQKEDEQLLAVLLLERGKARLILPYRPSDKKEDIKSDSFLKRSFSPPPAPTPSHATSEYIAPRCTHFVEAKS